MRIELAGKPILITGASAGIGRAAATACARAGMPVVLAARRADRLVELVDAIRAAGGRAIACAVDVRDPAACHEMVARGAEAFGPAHAVLANAGYGFQAPVHTLSDAELRAIFETNFFGTINTIRAALPGMLERRHGHVLITSSSIGVLPIPGHGHYGATKAAQHHIGRAMSAELRPLGVRVSTIHPIGTRTEFFELAARHAAERTTASPDAHAETGTTFGTNTAPHAGPGSNTPAMFMQSPETVARAIVNCLRRPRAEVWPGGAWWVRVCMAAAIAIPPLADALLAPRAGRGGR